MRKQKKSCPFIVAAAFLLAGIVSSTAQAEHIKVFLLGGQSNMDGRAATSDLPTTPVNLQQAQSDVLLYEGSTLGDLKPSGSDFGPEITFGRTLADTHADDNFALIKYAAGGTNLHTDWDPSGGSNNYTTFQTRVTNGISALTTGANAGNTYEIVGMLWTQGERDAKDGQTTTQYEANLNGFIADIRSNYGSDLPFFFNRLSAGQTDIPAGGLSAIRAAQDNVAAGDANAYLIDTDGFGLNGANLHFSAAGQQALGEAFAQSYLSTAPEPSSLVLIGAGALVLLQRRRRHN